MSTLTKVCIVVLVVLNLLCVPVFISLANVVPNYAKAFKQEEVKRLAAENNHRAVVAGAANLRAMYDRDRAADAAKITGLDAAVAKRDEDIKTAALAAVQLQEQLTTAQAARDREHTLAAAATDLNKKLVEQTAEQRAMIADKDKEILDSHKAREDADARATRDQAAARLAVEQLEAERQKNRELTEQLDRAKSGLPIAKAGTSDILLADKGPIIGTITSVNLKDGLASVNVGKVKGIEKGMVLVIYRSDQFIGRLQIESVELDHAAGIIVDKKVDPKVNDKVASKISLN